MRNFFYSWCSFLFKCVGHDIYCDGGFKPNLYTFYVWFILVLFSVSAIYTLLFYNWFTRLNVIGSAAIAAQVNDII